MSVIFTDAEILPLIFDCNDSLVMQEKYLKWLREPSNHSSIRINSLKNFTTNKLVSVLANVNDTSNLPALQKIKNDCLIIEKWKVDDILPDSNAAEVIVDVECGAAVLRGAHVFAPAVKGLPPGVKENDIVNLFADVDNQCKKGLKIKFEGNKIFIGRGMMKLLRSQLFDNNTNPRGIAVEVIMPTSKIPVLNETIAPTGEILLQNLPSIVCGWVVDAKPNEVILDMCAAPGNKTTHMAEMSQNKAIIIAIDKNESKVEKIKQKCKDHSVVCVQSFIFDSTKCVSETSRDLNDGPPFQKESFDKILLDGPCSVLGKRPQFTNKMTAKNLKSFHILQKKLFTNAAELLKPGGRLVYSTCTISASENEGIVAWALAKFPQLILKPAEPLLGGPGWPRVGLSDDQRLLVQRFGPENDPLRPVASIYRNSIGFFIACFEKIKK